MQKPSTLINKCFKFSNFTIALSFERPIAAHALIEFESVVEKSNKVYVG
jgi:hypothetical protein